MKILILGGDGMLGHQLVRSFEKDHEVHATLRGSEEDYLQIRGQLSKKPHFGIDAVQFSTVEALVGRVGPDAIVNCIGIVKQRDEAADAVLSIEVNSLFPHKLYLLAQQHGTRLVTISTDCVFSGDRGRYGEHDVPDAKDLYGRSKLLGEVYGEGALTLRTSIIGLELTRKKSLVEWFLAQIGKISGYSNAIYSGLTTIELARVIERCLLTTEKTSGLYHVSSDPISKFDLLCGLRDRLGIDIEILRDENFVNDKSLDSSQFRKELEYDPPSWDAMLNELTLQIEERNE